jgi:cell wall-associated NlpC family hydrolase
MRRMLMMLLVSALAWPSAAGAASYKAYVDVSVATVWVQPGHLRALDTPSTTNPVNMQLWLSRMGPAERMWLVGRVQTQALYGMQVTVIGHSGSWSKVVVHGQPTPLDPRGYPGWMPTRQLTGNTSLAALQRTHPVAVVVVRRAWLRDPTSFRPQLRVSFATRLPVVGRTGGYDLVATPLGGRMAIHTTSVAVYPSVTAIRHPTGAQLVATARAFIGLPYLWGGASGFGYDCSGFTWAVFRRFGIGLSRDADRQALHGTPVARSALRPGDLVFFAGPGGVGTIHHVGIYAGAGQIIDAPHTGAAVRFDSMAAFGSEYAGARRY